MSFEFTYFSYDELRTCRSDSAAYSGEKIILGERSTVPYALLRAVDLTTGEIINDLTSSISGTSSDPDKCWGLRCLHIYPALLALRRLACTYRRGDKRRHYLGALKFAAAQKCDPYTDDELTGHLLSAWKCSPDIYPLIYSLIPDNQLPAFTEAGWSTLNRQGCSLAGEDPESIQALRHFKLIP